MEGIQRHRRWLAPGALIGVIALTLSCGTYGDAPLGTAGGKADGDGWSATMVAATLASVNEATHAHFEAYTATGIGHYYGYRSSYARMSEQARRTYINSHKRGGTQPAMPEMISCINWVMLHLGRGYEAAGKAERWAEIVAVMNANDRDGVFLMRELKKDGWTALYWNPDARRPIDGNDEHPWSYQRVAGGHPYEGTLMDGMMINFRPSPGSSTVQDLSGLRALAKVPLWYGLAYGAYHTFLGMGDQMNESHSLREPNDVTNVEQGPFAALGTLVGKYNSGAILIPPGYWNPADTDVTPPPPGTWVGDSCSPQTGCAFFDQGGTAGGCHTFVDFLEQPQGFCSLPCAGYCDDLEGRAETFCVADPSQPGKGACAAKPHPSNGNCALIPGTAPRLKKRFVGDSSASPISRLACVLP